MKVSKISSCNINFNNNGAANVSPYLYTQKPVKEDKFTFKDHKWEYFGGIMAGVLALVSLSKFSAAKTLPKSIIELKENDLGLNKIMDSPYAVKVLKDNILYPLKCVDLGQKNLLRRNNFKTGVILCSENAEKAQKLKKALIEHIDKLGIKIYSITDENKINKANKVACAHKTINEANQMFTENSLLSIADIDDLAKITNLKANKTHESSKLEKKLIDQDPGVLWVAWTDKVNNIPYFYNNKKILCLRID